MYVVTAMKSELNNAVQVAQERVKIQFADAFRAIYQRNRVPDSFGVDTPQIDRLVITGRSDLAGVYYKDGFYIILTDRPVEGNSCKLFAGNLRAIYRGECATTRKRVTSHLFHSHYKADYSERATRYQSKPENRGKTFYEAFWPHCLKLEAGGPSGVDIDQDPNRNYSWLVVVHQMEGSSQEVRKLAELAFDEVFGHPAGSRDA
ncbi:hypothetical protein [Dechloromonas sp. H13]|uniref:hypothetical protein n=1 Tax=Dechloromonas sp. H13 TaxID=2570193 RepID=UPI00129144CF|nr:hypothetical protein [Dechloromonas sp. H13]